MEREGIFFLFIDALSCIDHKVRARYYRAPTKTVFNPIENRYR